MSPKKQLAAIGVASHNAIKSNDSKDGVQYLGSTNSSNEPVDEGDTSSRTPLLQNKSFCKHQIPVSHHQSASSNTTSQSELTEEIYLDDNLDYPEDHDFSPYRDTVLTIDPTEKMNCSNGGASNTRHSLEHDSCRLVNIDSQLIIGQVDGGDIEDTSEDEDDYDNPRYCKMCNIWYGSMDPSYPYRCNCVGTGGTGGTDTLNTIDTQSVYSVHMKKDFR